MRTELEHMTGAERELVQTAHNGDEKAFRHLVETHRSGLLAHCYRMLGSRDDAEDALQDTLLHAWRGLPRFDGRGAVHGWLYRIATNACLDAIARRPKSLPSVEDGRRDDLEDGYAAPDARYEQREAVGLALVMALQHLPPRQRAVLVLRDVLGFSAKEVSESLGMTVISVNSALQRARKAVDERVPETYQPPTVLAVGDATVHENVERFVDAFERGDVDVIIGLLAESAGSALSSNRRRRAGPANALATVSFPRFGLPSKLAA